MVIKVRKLHLHKKVVDAVQTKCVDDLKMSAVTDDLTFEENLFHNINKALH